jgi:AraC family chemosensory pili system transcriptional regulator ChpD
LNDLAADPERRVDRPEVWHDDTLPGVVWMSGLSSEYRVDPVDEYVIGALTGSAGYDLRRGSKTYRVLPGELVVLDPEYAHAGTQTVDGPWEARLLVLPAALLSSTCDDVPSLVRASIDNPVVDAPALRTRFLTLHRASSNGAAKIGRECALLGLLEDLAPAAGARPRRLGDPMVARALEYLRDCHLDPIDLDTLALEVGTTKFRLLRHFRAEVGLTPHQFVVSLRIAHARRLLAGGTPVSVAASESGFADQSHLTRYFRHRLGFTPGRYRQTVSKGR